MARRPTPEVREAFVKLYEDVFFELMSSMTKAASIEAKYAKFQDTAKQRTKKQLHQIARQAAEYFVDHSNPNPKKMSKERVDNLKVSAIEFALAEPHHD